VLRNLSPPPCYGFGFSETSVLIYQTTWRNPDDSNFHSYGYENFKYRVLILVYLLSFRFVSHIMWNIIMLSPCSKLILKFLTGQVKVITMNVCLEKCSVCMDTAVSAFANKIFLGSSFHSRNKPFLYCWSPSTHIQWNCNFALWVKDFHV
jgi:hypothetical protein